MPFTDPQKRREYNRRYRENHPEKMHLHRLKYKAKHAERLKEYNQIYRENHKKERHEYDITEERRLYHRIRGRKHRLTTVVNGKQVQVKNILKKPYPEPALCELCGKGNVELVYHHFDDTVQLIKDLTTSNQRIFLFGYWVCQPCNVFIHRIMEFSFLPEKWQKMFSQYLEYKAQRRQNY